MIIVDENLHDQRIMEAISAWYEVPDLLRRFFRLSAFETKALRMGKIIRLAPNHIRYYESDRRVQSLPWPG